MPTTVDVYNQEKTVRLESYEITLTCGKCRIGQLVADGEPNEAGEIKHTCDHCHKEQSITGGPYPRVEVRKVPAGERYLINKEEVPEKDPNEYNKQEVAQLPELEKIKLLQSTINPVIIDHLQETTINALHHTLDRLLAAMIDLAKQAAEIRAIGVAESELDEVLSKQWVNHYETPLSVLTILMYTTRRPENIELIVSRGYRPLFDFDLRKSLYDLAREVVVHRSKVNFLSTGQEAVKNKGGRPRKQTTLAEV
ncbi:hypothetical protein GCM10027592_63320 [Spirosoma flavus]